MQRKSLLESILHEDMLRILGTKALGEGVWVNT